MEMSRQEERAVNRVLNDVYNENKEIQLDDHVTMIAKKIVEVVVKNRLINKMKDVDELFKSCYQNIDHCGSFYDGLRIGEATEFDLNLVMHSVPGISFSDSVVPGYAVLHVKQDLMQNPDRFFSRFAYKGSIGYVLSPSEILSWLESVLARALNDFDGQHCIHGKIIQIHTSKSGPAHTLEIQSSCGIHIDVDLVPVFKFDDVSLVPKLQPTDPYLWRKSYPAREREIIKGCPKKVIKLLKRFRDVQGAPWKRLASYYIKTLVMLKLDLCPDSEKEDLWRDEHLGKLFIDVLFELHGYLQNGNIPSLYDRCNLLANVNSSTIDNMACCLQRILRNITTDPVQGLKGAFTEKSSGDNKSDIENKYGDEDSNHQSGVLRSVFIGSALLLGAVNSSWRRCW